MHLRRLITANSWISVTDEIRAGCTLSTFSEIVIGSSISMSRFTRLVGDLSAAAVVQFFNKVLRGRCCCVRLQLVPKIYFRIGNDLVTLDRFTLGSSLSVRSYTIACRGASVWSTFLESVPSVVLATHVGKNLSEVDESSVARFLGVAYLCKGAYLKCWVSLAGLLPGTRLVRNREACCVY